MADFQDLFQPNRRWTQWEAREIYTGQINFEGLYIPNVRDLIYDVDNRTIRKVTDVDQTTGLSTTIPWNIVDASDGASELDQFISTGPGTPSEAFRALLDTTVMPYRLRLDDRLHMYSADATNIRIFLGSDISSNGNIISTYYDQNGNFVSDQIPLQLATLPDGNNISIKVAKAGNSNTALNDGEIVTVVVYGALDDVLSTSQMVIKNTNFIQSGDVAPLFVIGITLKSPFVSLSDPYVLQYPVNATVDSANLKGVVHYSNGESSEFAVDGTKFTLHGLNGYISSQAGQRIPLVLTYNLSSGESSTDSNITQNGQISRTYYFESVTANGAYSVKLFGYPRWIDDAHGYIMEYYLYNLDREEPVNVTPWVQLASNSPAFNPTLYAAAQTFTVTVNLKDVNPLMQNYNHVQVINIVLNSRGSVMTVPNWTIAFSTGQNPRYGEHGVATLHQLSANVWTMDISCGRGSKEDWIRELFYYAQPLFNPQTEVEAPIPTHVEVVFKNYAMEITVDQWGSVLNVQNDLAQGEVVGLRWIKRTVNGDLQLARSALIVHVV